ncbi:M12 family metallo-peptidase [Akkermansiaceae bacterium]|nr:M12 family metallo-peptidase [Akkermansiaceae bacterium]
MKKSPTLLVASASLVLAHPGHFEPELHRQNGETTEVTTSVSAFESLPKSLSLEVFHHGESRTLVLRQSSVMSENFCIRLDYGNGRVEEHPCDGKIRTYSGHLAEDPGSSISAWVSGRGVEAMVTCSNGQCWELVPPLEAGGDHRVFDRQPDQGLPLEQQLTAYQKKMLMQIAQPDDLLAAFALPQTVTVYEAEIGFEVSNRTFREDFKGDVNWTNFAPNGDHGKGFENNADLANRYIQSFVNDLNKRFIPDVLVKLRVGVVNIWMAAGTDPYEGRSTQTSTLELFRDIWNGNNTNFGARPSSTHDLAHAMIGGAGDSAAGRAWVGQITESLRYSVGGTSNGSGLNYWKGVAKHEIVHSWGGSHGDGNQLEFNGNGTHYGYAMIQNIDGTRINSIEQGKMLNERNSSTGGLTNIGPISVAEMNANPYCLLDRFDVLTSADPQPVLLDVLKNDHDANNTPFQLESFTLYQDGGLARVDNATTTRLGASISISEGSGPGGRDQILYTPAPGVSGTDQFLYIVRDEDGRGSTGNLIVTLVSSDPGVALFANTNQGGSSALWSPGLHRQGHLKSTDVGGNQASSIRVPLNFSAHVWDSDSLRNNEGYRVFEPGIYNLTDFNFLETGTAMNDKISALRVTFTGPDRPHVEIYADKNFVGTPGLYNAEEDGVSNGVYRRSRLDWSGIGNDEYFVASHSAGIHRHSLR